MDDSGELDCYDDTTGAGTSGTANHWTDNEDETSSPAGLCGDDEEDDDDDDEDDGDGNSGR